MDVDGGDHWRRMLAALEEFEYMSINQEYKGSEEGCSARPTYLEDRVKELEQKVAAGENNLLKSERFYDDQIAVQSKLIAELRDRLDSQCQRLAVLERRAERDAIDPYLQAARQQAKLDYMAWAYSLPSFFIEKEADGGCKITKITGGGPGEATIYTPLKRPFMPGDRVRYTRKPTWNAAATVIEKPKAKPERGREGTFVWIMFDGGDSPFGAYPHYLRLL